MRITAGLLLFVMLASCMPEPALVQPQPAPTNPWSLESAMETLTRQLVAGFPPSGRPRVAVLEPEPLAGGTATTFERYVAEELTARLFRTGQAQVIERAHLRRILDELNLATSPAVDPDAASKLGQLLGADYLVTGSTADMGSYLHITMRVLETRTGTLAATAMADVTNDWSIARLRGPAPTATGNVGPARPGPTRAPGPTGTSGPTGAPQPGTPMGAQVTPGATFIDMRAAGFEVGERPAQWGGELTVLKTSDNVKYMGIQTNGSAEAVVSADFPDNWSLTVLGTFASWVEVTVVVYDARERPYKIVFNDRYSSTTVRLPTGESGTSQSRMRAIRLNVDNGLLRAYVDDQYAVSGQLRGYGSFRRVSVSIHHGNSFYGVVAIRAQAL